MAEDATAGVNPLLSGLLDEIVTWEILVRLDPKSVLRCRAVRRDWRRVTSTRRFLLANHSRQPTLPIFDTSKFIDRVHYHIILTFDHRAANNTWRKKGLNLAARLDKGFRPVALCDGLLVLSKYNRPASGTCLSICNPATREHASLGPLWGDVLTPTYRRVPAVTEATPRYIGWPETASWCIHVPVMVRDCLHWYPTFYLSGRAYLSESKPVIVLDTIAESLRQMRAPIFPTDSYIFEMDGTLGIHNHNRDTQVIDIWVLQNYEREIWDFKYHIKLPITEISTFRGSDEHWDVGVISRDGDLLFLNYEREIWDFKYHIKLPITEISTFRGSDEHWDVGVISRDGDLLFLLKQSLVQHTFFPALEGYAVNTSPFV
uniref:F-box associated domain-containing protein n=1 Tax=Aegilops tauschii TaxID=37682 RepID=N1QYS8_AEGTA